MLLGQESVLQNVESMLNDVITQNETSKSRERNRELLRWLSTHDFQSKHTRASALRNERTCSWLVDTPQFQALVHSDTPCLWLYGIAGSGKTILTSSIIDYFMSGPASDESILAYFYCDASDSESQRLVTVLGALLCQICTQLAKIPDCIETAFHEATSMSGQQLKPAVEQLQSMIVVALSYCRNPIIVVDGLDEAFEREDLCELLVSLAGQKSSLVRLLVTSRPEPDIRRHFEDMNIISAQCEAADNDIDHYIVDRIASNARFRKMSDGLRRHVHHALREGAQGM
jgi:hypothetical protein